MFVINFIGNIYVCKFETLFELRIIILLGYAIIQLPELFLFFYKHLKNIRWGGNKTRQNKPEIKRKISLIRFTANNKKYSLNARLATTARLRKVEEELSKVSRTMGEMRAASKNISQRK